MAQIYFDPVIGPQLLETLTTALYEDPIIIFREYVQNSVDSFNLSIDTGHSNEFEEFSVDINIDRRRRAIRILDNGYGIPKDKFLEKMLSIGASEKPKYKNLIGFRGIGRLAAMPSCRHLTFTNKIEGSEELQLFTWNGDKFHQLLNQAEEHDFRTTIQRITNFSVEKYTGDINDHFFQVEVRGYKEEIAQLIDAHDFKERLCLLLPLKYAPEFTYQEEIKTCYEEYMGQSLDRFCFIVRLENEVLYKLFTNKDILESGVVYWKLNLRNVGKRAIDEKIGILWFTFNKKIERKRDEPYGIYVRSRNMLMGDKYSLATDTSRSKTDYVTTPRELSQMLNGVSGEMLIHSTRLNDNARRDWFRIDEEFFPLRNIIVDFMKRLHTYRYTASRFFKNKSDRDKLIKAYTELTNFESKKVISAVSEMQKEVVTDRERLDYANEDIPAFPITIRRFYERVIDCLHSYFKREKKLEEFIKVRTLLKEFLNRE